MNAREDPTLETIQELGFFRSSESKNTLFYIFGS